MRRMWAAGAAIVMCLALGGMPVVAQSPATPEAGAWVTGSETCSLMKEGTTTYVNGVEQYRDGVFTCTMSMSDPRLSGAFTVHYNYDCYELSTPMPKHGGCVMWGTNEWPGPDGWVATYTGIEDARGQQQAQFINIGTGANEGWVFVEFDTWSDGTAPIAVEGLLYQGAPPPLMPLPSPVSK